MPFAEKQSSSLFPVLPWLLGIFFVSLGLRLGLVAAFPQFAYEDALITFRFAENLAGRLGFVYNAGERVLGTTTPLYTLLLALFYHVTGNLFLSSGIFNSLLDAFSSSLAFLLLARKGRLWQGVFTALTITVYAPLLRVPVSRMETSLYIALILGVLFLFAERRYRLAAALAGILAIVRIDGLILTTVLAAALIIKESRFPLPEATIWLGVSLPWFLFSFWYFGSVLPNTLLAKSTVYASQHPFGSNLLRLAMDMTWGNYGHRLVLLPLFLIGGIDILRRERWLAPALGWFGMYLLFFGLSRTFVFDWYVAPLFPIYLIVVMQGLFLLPWGSFPIPQKHLVLALGAVFLALFAVFSTGLAYRQLREAQRYEETVRKPLGIWLRDNTPSGTTVCLEPIGYIGYYSQRRILDLLGLVSPQVIPFVGQLGYPSSILPVAEAFAPDYCVLREKTEYQQLAQEPGMERFERMYNPIAQWGEFIIFKKVVLPLG